MSINCTDKEALERFLKTNLKESRYRHSLGVEEMAVRLAGLHGGDPEKAAFAGRYHDIAKNFDRERMDGCIRKYGLDEKLIGNNALAHSKVGAAILEHEFGITDEDVLNAVRFHTTARRGMSLLEQLWLTWSKTTVHTAILSIIRILPTGILTVQASKYLNIHAEILQRRGVRSTVTLLKQGIGSEK